MEALNIKARADAILIEIFLRNLAEIPKCCEGPIVYSYKGWEILPHSIWIKDMSGKKGPSREGINSASMVNTNEN